MAMVYDAEYDTWYDDGSYADGTDYGNVDEFYGYGDGYYDGTDYSSDSDNIDAGGGWSPADELIGPDVTEIPNEALPGQPGYGWRYFSDSTVISPSGQYYHTDDAGNQTMIYDPATSGSWLSKLGTTALNRLKSTFTKKDAQGRDVTDWAALITAGTALYNQFGGDSASSSPAGYNKSIPKLDMVRQQVQYNDPNRRPGEAGRQYFTDTQYVPQGDGAGLAAAKEAAATQAAGLTAAAPQAAPKVNPWAGKMNLGALKPAEKAAVAKAAADTSYPLIPKAQGLDALPGASTSAYKPSALTSGQETKGVDPEDAYKASLLKLQSEQPSAAPKYQSATLPDGTVIGGKVGVVDGGFSLWDAPALSEAEINQGKAELANKAAANPTGITGDMNQQLTAAQSKGLAMGGIANLAKGGRYLSGKTDGMADKIPTSIDGKDPAALSHGEFVIPADVVSHLGNGNSDAGAQKLYDMMARIRKARTGNEKQGKRIDPDKFMPGGLAKAYMTGGAVKGFPDGGTVPTVTTNTPTTANATGTTGGTPRDTSTSSTLSPWVGDYVTDALGQGAALADQPYQAYTGPLTAGTSDLQNQAFAGASELTAAGYTPTTFSTGTFDATAANQYMNPYLSAALQPSLDEARRQAQISRLEDATRLTKAGAFGGGRQAIMESELNRNLMDKQNKMLTEGYATAYDKAMNQFNTEQGRQFDVQKADEASRQFGADFGIKSLDQLAKLGAEQRAIEQEGIAADKAQFEEQRDWAYKMPQYQLDLLKNLPIKTETTSVNQTTLDKLMGDIAGLRSLYESLSGLGQTGG